MKVRATSIATACLGLLGAANAHAAGSLNVGAAITDLDAPSTFVFSFQAPIVAEAGLVTWHFNGDFGLGDGGRDGVTATKAVGEFFEAFAVDGSFGLHSLALAGGNSRNGPGNQQFFLTGMFDCGALTGGCAGLAIDFGFTGSGGNDSYSMVSHLDIEPKSVPEPGSLTLLALGIAGLGGVTRWRKRA